MELLIQLFAELFFQFLVEGLADLGIHTLSGRRKAHPLVSAIGYALLGVILGALSLALIKDPFLEEPTWRIVNVIITPVFVGGAMGFVGTHRAKKGKKTVSLETFFNAYLFALGFALIRYFFA